MMKCLTPTYYKELRVVEFKGVPPKEIVDISKLDIDGLKLECKRRGIKYHHKAGIKKLTELLNAN
jgi:hypothetical protein